MKRAFQLRVCTMKNCTIRRIASPILIYRQNIGYEATVQTSAVELDLFKSERIMPSACPRRRIKIDFYLLRCCRRSDSNSNERSFHFLISARFPTQLNHSRWLSHPSFMRSKNDWPLASLGMLKVQTRPLARPFFNLVLLPSRRIKCYEIMTLFRSVQLKLKICDRVIILHLIFRVDIASCKLRAGCNDPFDA